jgi:hypothetical protein
MGNSSEFDRALPGIAKKLEDVSAQLADLSAELRSLAQRQDVDVTPPGEPVTRRHADTTPPEPPADRTPPMRPLDETGRPVDVWKPSAQEPAPPRPTLAQRLGAEGAGSKVLVWIGGAVTLVGVVLMLILAIQRGWIGPVPRVVLGALLAGALIGVSLVAHRTPAGRAGAFALAATGVAALYLDLVAATTLLGLLPPWLGLAGGLLIAAAGLLLAARWEAQPFAVFVLLGCALCAPFITTELNAMLLGFLLVLQVAATPVQLLRNWVWVPLVAGLPPIVVALVAARPMIAAGDELQAVGMSLLASLLTAAVAVLTAVRRPSDDMPLFLLASAALPTLALGQQVSVGVSTSADGLLGVPMLAVWAFARFADRGVPARVGAVAGGIAAVCGFQILALQLTGDARVIGLLAAALLMCLIAVLVRGRGVLLAAAGFGLVGTLLAILTIAGVVRIVQPPVDTPEPQTLAVGALAYGLMGAAALALLLAHLRLNALVSDPIEDDGVSQLVAGVIMLYGACGMTLCLALLVSPDRTGFLAGHSVVTVSWMIAALVLLHRGITRRGPRIAGLVLVDPALLKLVLFDLAALDGLARVAAFLGAGLVLLGAGVRYTRLVAQRAESGTESTPQP